MRSPDENALTSCQAPGQRESTSSRAWWAGIAIVVVCVLLGWLVWPDASELPDDGPARSGVGAVGGIEGRRAGPGERAEVEAGLAMRGDDPAGSSSGEWISLRVVDGGTRLPIADAEVLFETFDDRDHALAFDESLALFRTKTSDSETFLRRVGRATRTDADGRCRVPFDSWARIAGRAGQRYGEAFLMTLPSAEHVLELHADAALTVDVRDAVGRPAAGVEVVRFTARADGVKVRERIGETDAGGRLVRRHARTLAEPGGKTEIAIAAAPLGATTTPRRVDLAAPPGEPIVFRLPPTGSLTLRVIDAGGAPVTAGPFLTRDLRGELRRVGGDPTWTVWFDRELSCRFEHVVLDGRFQASVGELFSAPRGFDGPTRARPDVHVELRLDAEAVLVAGRAVDDSGRPHHRRLLQFNFVHADTHVGAMVETDANGRFEAVLRALRPGSQPEMIVFLWPQGSGDLRPHGRFVTDRPLVAGRNDLGDVTLDFGPLLCSGRISNQDGEPVTDAGVRVEQLGADGWTWVQAQVAVDDSGSFEFRGEVPPGRLRICRSSILYLLDEPIEFEVGATDLDVRLLECGSIPFVLAVDDGTPWTDLELRLVPHEDGSGYLRSLVPDSEARVQGRWDGVRPGRHRIEVWIDQEPTPVIALDGVVVEPGRAAEDPRLVPIDLTGQLGRVSVAARSATGAALEGLLALVPDSRAPSWRAFEPDADGRIGIPFVTAIGQVLVLARGHHPATLRGLSRDVELTLERMPACDIVLEPASPLPDSLKVRVELRPVPPNPLAGATVRGHHTDARLADRGYHARTVEVDARAELELAGTPRASFHLRSPGPYRATVRHVAPGAKPVAVDLGAAGDFDWQPGRAPVRIPLTGAALSALCR